MARAPQRGVADVAPARDLASGQHRNDQPTGEGQDHPLRQGGASGAVLTPSGPGRIAEASISLETADWRPVVYAIQCRSAEDGGPIKIGRTERVALRLAQLQEASPFVMRLLAVRPCADRAATITEESALHTRFASSRMCGEWFRPTAALLAVVRDTFISVRVSVAPPTVPLLLPVNDAAEQLGIAVTDVHQHIKQGALRTIFVGRSQRVLLTDVQALLGHPLPEPHRRNENMISGQVLAQHLGVSLRALDKLPIPYLRAGRKRYLLSEVLIALATYSPAIKSRQ